jgi:hypothetical protein
VQLLNSDAQLWRTIFSFWNTAVQPPLYPQHPVVFRIGSTEVTDEFRQVAQSNGAFLLLFVSPNTYYSVTQLAVTP